jgi:hypothetical protein
MAIYLTWNSTLERAGSTVQVPVGTAVVIALILRPSRMNGRAAKL